MGEFSTTFALGLTLQEKYEEALREKAALQERYDKLLKAHLQLQANYDALVSAPQPTEPTKQKKPKQVDVSSPTSTVTWVDGKVVDFNLF